VDSVIDALAEADAGAVSKLTHRLVGWRTAHPGESIPYETIFHSDGPLCEADLERGREVAAEDRRLAAREA
jgi:catalase (peroxidase I)